MPTSRAEVRTDRASRYLSQLCSHGSHMSAALAHVLGGHGGGGDRPQVRRAEWSGSEGFIEFEWGRCIVEATDTGLVLIAEADDDTRLVKIKAGVGARVQRIGRRDGLTVDWHEVVGGNPD